MRAGFLFFQENNAMGIARFSDVPVGVIFSLLTAGDVQMFMKMEPCSRFLQPVNAARLVISPTEEGGGRVTYVEDHESVYYTWTEAPSKQPWEDENIELGGEG
jgi:hypothetical protein